MTVLIVYNAPPENASVADNDVLTQVIWLEATLARMSIISHRLACTLNLAELDSALQRLKPSTVFYLVESLAGTDALAHLAAELIEARRVSITGSPASSLKQLVSKTGVKRGFHEWGMATPAWMDSRGAMHDEFLPDRYILKADLEHASLGIDERSIVYAEDTVGLRNQLLAFQKTVDRPCLAEQFIEGREFNVSLLDCGGGSPEVLSLAEIDFSSLPGDRPRIVGWKAKWDKHSIEYENTPRAFPDMANETELAVQLRSLSIQCWRRLNLRGYARVDFRVSGDGRAWLLEVNANPCLSPDAGFYAAARKSGLSDEAIVGRIIAAATREPQRLSE